MIEISNKNFQVNNRTLQRRKGSGVFIRTNHASAPGTLDRFGRLGNRVLQHSLYYFSRPFRDGLSAVPTTKSGPGVCGSAHFFNGRPAARARSSRSQILRKRITPTSDRPRCSWRRSAMTPLMLLMIPVFHVDFVLLYFFVMGWRAPQAGPGDAPSTVSGAADDHRSSPCSAPV